MEENGAWKEHWKVAAFMVNKNQRIQLKSLADIFQELANNHANYHKCGFENMKASGRFWVLNRQCIQVTQWPRWEQSLKVESWLSMMKGAQGEIIAKASYLWTSIDKVKMKPTAIPDGGFPVILNRSFDLPEAKKIKIDGEVISNIECLVKDSDLDIIGHTNNATYLQWASDMLVSGAIDFNLIEANYTGESFAGQKVAIHLLKDDFAQYGVEVLNQDGRSIFKLNAK